MRVFTGKGGIRGRYVHARPPFVVPSTSKISFLTSSIKSRIEDYDGVSGCGKLWSCKERTYRIETPHARACKMEEGAQGALLMTGVNWLLLDGSLVFGREQKELIMPYPLPDYVVPGLYFTELTEKSSHSVTSALLTDRCFFAGLWSYVPIPIAFVRETREHRRLRRAMTGLSGREKALLQERLDSLPASESLSIGNGHGVYSMAWYDWPEEGAELLPARGCLWLDEAGLHSCGERSAGDGFVITTGFDSSGRCIGLSAVNDGEFKAGAVGGCVPAFNGVAHVTAPSPLPDPEPEPRETLGALIPCGTTWSGLRWGGEKLILEVPPDGYISPLWGWLDWPWIGYFAEGEFKAMNPNQDGHLLGGEGSTIDQWYRPADGAIVDMVGPGVVVQLDDKELITDVRDLRRYVVPGSIGDAFAREDGLTVLSNRIVKGRPEVSEAPAWTPKKEVPYAQSVKSITVLPGQGRRPSMDITEDHIVVPWTAKVDEPLEIGWWSFPDLGVQGTPPNPDGLGDGEGWNDFNKGTFLLPRRGASVTADGYVYLSAHNFHLSEVFSVNTVDVLSFFPSPNGWERNRISIPCEDGRVAPYGHGSYQVHHYPGEDWSLFHAPVGRVNYSRIYKKTDWSFLSALSGLAGGFALSGALQVQEALEDYMEQSFGNLMVVYTDPNQVMAIGDPMFRSYSVLPEDKGFFWSFMGWRNELSSSGPMAIFNRIKASSGNIPVPEIWGVTRMGRRRISPTEAGELGERALHTIPSNYQVRLSIIPDTESSLPPEVLASMEGLYAYDLPAPTPETIGSLGGKIADRYNEWLKKRQSINKSAIALGQSYNHQILEAAVVDPATPIVDLRLEMVDGTTWAHLQHETGIWISLRCAVPQGAHYHLERLTEWQLVSLGVHEDGDIVALFGNGICSLSVGDLDKYLAVLGFADWWKRFAMYSWYARLHPIRIKIEDDGYNRLMELLSRHKD